MATGTLVDEQKTTKLLQVVVDQGQFPSDSGAATDGYVGLVRTFAFNFSPGGVQANGSVQSSNESVLSFVEGAQYGGDGVNTYAVPDLRGTAIVGRSGSMPNGVPSGSNLRPVGASQFPSTLGGTSQPVPLGQKSETLTWLVATSSAYFPSPSSQPPDAFLGEVVPFTGTTVPAGFSVADGSTVSIRSNPTLFAVLGTTYGGDGITTFKLPNLNGRDVVGAGTSGGTTLSLGQSVGSTQTTLTRANLPPAQGGTGQAVDVRQPGLALNYIVATQGDYPVRDGETTAYGEPIMGEVKAFAGSAAMIPAGWHLADGSIMPIAQNSALFSLLGATYGGDGRTTFALPNLIGSAVEGSTGTSDVGQVEGANFQTLAVTDANPCYCPGTLILTDAGQRRVEDLEAGDVVVTASGRHRPVVWVGRRAYGARFVRNNPALAPVRFAAGCLGEDLPRRDLLVSPDHAMMMEGVLIPAIALVDGIDVTRDHGHGDVGYVHVELESHDVLLAEGVPSESFVDDGGRAAFANAATREGWSPTAIADVPAYCAPRLTSGPKVEAARAAIAKRRGARNADASRAA